MENTLIKIIHTFDKLPEKIEKEVNDFISKHDIINIFYGDMQVFIWYRSDKK